MAMNDQDTVQRKLRAEWYAALAIVIGGFVIAIAVAGYLTFANKPANTASNAPQSLTPAQVQEARNEAVIKLFTRFCQIELANAKSFGIVPNYGRLASPLPHMTDIKGRYVCIAATEASKYEIAGDLMCGNMRDPRCVRLFSVSQDDGTVLYQRQG